MIHINKIFESFDGEVCHTLQGRLCTFVRVQGCNLKCSYCDTPESVKHVDGTSMPVEEVVSICEEMGNPKITITGGEPFLQTDLPEFVLLATQEMKAVFTIETNGSLYIPNKIRNMPNVQTIFDYKLDNEDFMVELVYFAQDVPMNTIIKFPIQNWGEFHRACDVIREIECISKNKNRTYAFSPVGVSANTLAKALQGSRIKNAILNIQIHKLIGIS